MFVRSLSIELLARIIKNKLISKANTGTNISQLGVDRPLLKPSIFLTNPTIISIIKLKIIVFRIFISILIYLCLKY
jgi:hypothetical protein